MKYTFAVLALISMASVEQVNAITRQAPVGVTFVESDSDSSDSDDDLVQIQGDFFYARDIGAGPLDKKYERKVPEQFATGADDLFMRSMISTYAREVKNGDGEPNGSFSMTEASTRAAAAEVLATHKKTLRRWTQGLPYRIFPKNLGSLRRQQGRSHRCRSCPTIHEIPFLRQHYPIVITFEYCLL